MDFNIIRSHALRLKIAISFMIMLLTGNNFLPDSIPSAWGGDYYVSNSTGSDNAPGISPELPWKSLNKVNSVTLNPGDRILLKRGDMWRESLVFARSGEPNNPIVLTAYGTGTKPQINGSALLTGWTNYASGIYQVNYSGFCLGLLEDGVPISKASSAALTDGSWYYDGSASIYYRPASGTANDHVIESCRRNIIQMSALSYMSISDIEVYGAGGNGIMAVNSSNLEIKDCAIKNNAGHGIGIINYPNKAGSPCFNVMIQGNTISWNANGIYIVSENGAEGHNKIDVVNNLIEYNDFNHIWKHVTPDGHGLAIQCCSGSYFGLNEIRYNRTGPAIWTQVDRRSDNNVIARNFIHHNQKFGVNLGGEGQDNNAGNVFAYNIISDNGTDEGLDGGFRINRKQSGKNFFNHNTLVRNDVNIYLYSLTDFAIIYKNISFAPKYYHALIEGSLNNNFFAENLYFPDGPNLFGLGSSRSLDFAAWRTKTNLEKGSVVGDPLFSDPALSLPEHFTPSAASPVELKLTGPTTVRVIGVPYTAVVSAPNPPAEYNVDFFGQPPGTTPFIGAVKRQQQ